MEKSTLYKHSGLCSICAQFNILCYIYLWPNSFSFEIFAVNMVLCIYLYISCNFYVILCILWYNVCWYTFLTMVDNGFMYIVNTCIKQTLVKWWIYFISIRDIIDICATFKGKVSLVKGYFYDFMLFFLIKYVLFKHVSLCGFVEWKFLLCANEDLFENMYCCCDSNCYYNEKCHISFKFSPFPYHVFVSFFFQRIHGHPTNVFIPLL